MFRIGLFTLLLIVSCGINSSVGLQCYRCSYTKLESDSSVLSFLLSAINAFSDEHCKLEKAVDETEVAIRTCPTPSEGKVAKCFDVKGDIRTTTTLPIVGTSIGLNIYTISRDCIEVSKSDSSTSNGCHKDLPSTAQQVIKDFYTNSISLGEMTLKGEACYSSDSLTNAGNQIRNYNWILFVIFVTICFTMY